MSVLYYLGVMQVVVKGLAWVMQRTLRTSGAETLSASGNIFLGPDRGPAAHQAVRREAHRLGALHGHGRAASPPWPAGVLAAYVLMLQGVFPDIAGHLLAASVMNAPAGLLLSKIIRPETETPAVARRAPRRGRADRRQRGRGGGERGRRWASSSPSTWAAMLMAFIALIAMVNFGIGWAGGLVGVEGLTPPVHLRHRSCGRSPG